MGRLVERKTGPAIYEALSVWSEKAFSALRVDKGSPLDFSNSDNNTRGTHPVPRDPCSFIAEAPILRGLLEILCMVADRGIRR